MCFLQKKESDDRAVDDGFEQSLGKARRPRRFGKRYNLLMKWVRRTHMYTGLVLLPWVLMFGASGVLFNHPTWLSPSDVVYQESGEKLRELTGFEKSDPIALAGVVVDRLNEGQGRSEYELVEG